MGCSFYITVGDYYDDGHGKYDRYLVKSNLPFDYVQKANDMMKERFGFSMLDLCSDYQDNYIPKQAASTMISLGADKYAVNVGKTDGILRDSEYFYIDSPDTFAYLWVYMLMETLTELELEIVPEPSLDSLPQAGYGLYD